MTFEGMTKLEAVQELRALRRLHEEATMRNVAFSAVIEEVRAAVQYADIEQMSGLDTRIVIRDLVQPIDSRRALRGVRHRVLIDIAEELEADDAATVDAAWLRHRAMGILVGQAR